MHYIAWAFLGMVGYSLVTLFVKLATRSGQFSSFLVLTISSVIVLASTLSMTLWRGDLRALSVRDFAGPSACWAYAAGVALAVAVIALFRALSLGPATIVVPIYGMFIVGGSVLGMLFLGESLNLLKLLGLVLAVTGVFLIATSSGGH